MKIVLAPDSFKGCLRSPEICDALREGILSVRPDAEVISVPMADGGEGSTEAVLKAAGGELRTVTVRGPLGKPVEASFALLNDKRSAVLEMAAASGIELLSNDELNPLLASTFGTGELLRAALDAGAREIIMGIGGSATVDGGAGFIQALGVKLLDCEGNDLPGGGGTLARLDKLIVSGLDPRLRETRLRIACDVTNPLLGERGAASVFGPQKGASPVMVEELESNLVHYAETLKKSGLVANSSQPGDGAAGGLGFALRVFCGAEMVSGARLLAEITHLQEKMRDADLVITGEGCTDGQTSSGKLCSVIAELAREENVPVILLSGALKGDLPGMHETFTAAFSISTGPSSLSEALPSARKNLFFAARNIARLL
ncbi:MAG: glycerate kinase [Lentisphaerae bacterium GWF2_52_8]|nr:MAG: glycerate kinase [Lentisphaerae bacterium GWF2_52_8]